MRRGRVSWAVVCAGALLALLGCSGADRSPSGAPSTPPPAPGTNPGSNIKGTVALDLTGDTTVEAPIAGLLAVALSPDGSRLFTYGDTLDGSVALRVFPFTPGNRTSTAEGRVLLRVPHPYVHSGGGLVVAPDGDVFVSVGAFERSGVPRAAQNPDGVVVRVPAEVVNDPAAPPFVPGEKDLVARGLRNPWRMTRDRQTGDLWIGDVGDGTAEEVDRVPAADLAAGRQPNFGFPYLEGTTELLPPDPAATYTAPVWFHGRANSPANSIIGGYRYRGSKVPGLRGWYLFSDFSEKIVRAIDPGVTAIDGPAPAVAQLPSGPTGFAEGPDGELLVMTVEGQVYRLEPKGGTDRRALEARQVLSVTTGQFTGVGSEATSFAVLPDGSGVVASMRAGQVTWTPFVRTRGRVCGLELVQLPQGALATDLRGYVESSTKQMATFGDELPLRLQPERRRNDALFARATELAGREGWDSPRLAELLRTAALERGEFADVLRAQSKIVNYVSAACPGG